MLSGRAVSNVFDNDMELDSGHANMTLLKGVKSQGDIGLLSLFEHYNICKVSDNAFWISLHLTAHKDQSDDIKMHLSAQ